MSSFFLLFFLSISSSYFYPLCFSYLHFVIFKIHFFFFADIFLFFIFFIASSLSSLIFLLYSFICFSLTTFFNFFRFLRSFLFSFLRSFLKLSLSKRILSKGVIFPLVAINVIFVFFSFLIEKQPEIRTSTDYEKGKRRYRYKL